LRHSPAHPVPDPQSPMAKSSRTAAAYSSRREPPISCASHNPRNSAIDPKQRQTIPVNHSLDLFGLQPRQLRAFEHVVETAHAFNRVVHIREWIIRAE